MMPKILKLLAGFIIAMMSVTTANAADTREIGDSFSADGIDVVSINAGVGSVELIAGGGDEITVLVSIEPDDGWFGGPDREDLEKITLKSASKKGKLSLGLDFPRGLDEDDIEEHWEIEIPARLQAKVRIGVGRISIEGVAGGVGTRMRVLARSGSRSRVVMCVPMPRLAMYGSRARRNRLATSKWMRMSATFP